MKKIYLVLFTAALATTFAACSKDDATTAITSYEEIVKAQPVPVTFGTYVSENAVTRAGEPGNIKDDDALHGKSFGVFAYNSEGDYVASGASAKAPNFMYNQTVNWNNTNTAWEYAPIKFWPNDYNGASGSVDHQTSPATGTVTNKLSFFAYAPLVEITSDNLSSGTVTPATSGITGFSGNSTPGDPTVSYTIGTTNTIGGSVDLLWGVAPSGATSYTAANGSTVTLTPGIPLKNLVKPATSNATMTFAFNHALAGLNLTAKAAFNKGTTAYTEIPTDTYIHINEVTITAIQLTGSGVLNLNNETAYVPNWTTLTPQASETVNTFTLTNSKIIENLRYTSGVASGSLALGVGRLSTDTNTKTSAAQQVIDGNEDDEGNTVYNNVFLLLPKATATEFTVTVDYYVRTKDDNLAGGISEVHNVITKSVTIPVPGVGVKAIEGNKVYTINMILGLEEVTLDATVAPWGNGTSRDVYLPENS